MIGGRDSSLERTSEPAWRGHSPLSAALDHAAPHELIAALALALAGVLPPIALMGTAAIGSAVAKLFLATLLAVPPGLLGLGAALIGLQQVLQRFRSRHDREHEQAVFRVLCAALLFAYVFAVGTAPSETDAAAAALAVLAFALAASWLALLAVLLRPAASPARRWGAAVGDAVALSLFLHLGGALAAPWFGLYGLAALYGGWRFGSRGLWTNTLLGLAGFAAVVVTTGFWQQQLWLTTGVFVTLLALPAYAAAVIHDIAASRRQVREADAAKKRFLSIIGRELRAPLNAMLGVNGPPGRARGVAPMQLSARTLLSQINDIIDYSQIETGTFAPKTEAFDLHELVNDTLAVLRQHAAAKGLNLTLRVDPSLPYRLRGWPNQLRRVLTNLVSHAIKATEKGRIRIGLDQVGHDERATRLRLSIRDDSPGIEPEAREGLFDPFASDPSSPGRGDLGLAIARRLVLLMGGEIHLDSEPGRGNLFAVTLPFAFDFATAERALDLARHPVLIVTDDAQFASDLAEPLNAWQAEVRWIGMSEAALAYIEQFEPPQPRPILIIDGRREVLEALTFAHRIVTASADQPTFALFVAEPPWIDPLIELADGELSGLLPWPLTDRVLGNALHALPLSLPNAASAGGAADPAVVNRQPPRRAATPANAAPPKPSRSEPSGGAAGAMPTAQRLRILVADVDAAVAQWAADVLAERGHLVETAGDGEEALRALEQADLDVALIGVEMPRLTGYDAVRLYRMNHPEGERLPIIALAVDGGFDTERLCRDAGMDAVLAQPVAAEDLVATVEEAAAVVGELAARAAESGSVVTPIASHPRFMSENAPVVDERAVESLRSLGAGSDFFRDVIESFRLDSRDMLQRIGRAAASADTGSFRESVHALRSCAANVGGVRLCDMLLALRDVTARELRQQGMAHVQRLTTELSRLDTALLGFLHDAEEQRR